MQRVRLERLIEAYGADPARWPAAEREAAARALAETPGLDATLDEARRLDRLLDGYAPATAPGFAARLDRALAELPAQGPAAAAVAGRPRLAWVLPRAVMLAAASAAGIMIGLGDIGIRGAAIARIDVVTLISDPELISMLE